MIDNNNNITATFNNHSFVNDLPLSARHFPSSARNLVYNDSSNRHEQHHHIYYQYQHMPYQNTTCKKHSKPNVFI